MAIELYEIGAQARAKILDVVTNAAGRTDEPLIHGQPLRAGRYELVFRTEDYFRQRGVPLPAIPFIGDAVIRFGSVQPDSASTSRRAAITSPWW